MAKGKAPAFMLYPGDWLSSTSIMLMSPAEEGAYIRLLCHAWAAPDCGLPSGDEELSVLSRLGAQWIKSAPRLRAQFYERYGRIFNERLLKEREKLDEWQRKSSEGGKRSAETRAQAKLKGGSRVVDEWLQPTVNQTSTPAHAPVESEITTTSPSPEKPLRDSVREFQARFAEWLGGYRGRKAQPDQACRIWLSRINTPEEAAAAFACRDRYNASDEVARGVLKEAHNFLMEQSDNRWSGAWPRANGAAPSVRLVMK